MTKAGDLVEAAATLASSDVETIATAFRDEVPGTLVSATMRRLHAARERDAIWRLHAAFPGLGIGEPAGDHVRLAPLHFYFSRIMLEIGAAESAWLGFSWLLAHPALMQGLERPEAAKLKLFFARACLRSGRSDEALRVWREVAAETPPDWLAHFQIGAILSAGRTENRYACFRAAQAAAEAAGQSIPGKLRAVMIEALLDDGASDQALAGAEAAIRAEPDDPELFLALANAHAARGDVGGWRRAAGELFEARGLSPPPFAVPRRDGAELPIHVDTAATAGAVQAGGQVTVVMTAHNAAATIRAAITSVLSQTYANLRLVVVDDASEDDTSAIAAAIADARVRVMRNERNTGTYYARNRGIAACPSDFYTFHDADDWMHPRRIEEHVALMRRRPELAFATSQWFRMDAFGRAAGRRDGGYLYENPASAFLRRAVIDEAGYFDAVRAGADSEFSWRVRRRFGEAGFAHIEKPLAVGFHHTASLTQSGAAAFDAFRFSSVRLQYWEAWVEWHRECVVAQREDRLAIPRLGGFRPFATPPQLLP